MIATCGQWFTAAYKNPCLACEKKGTLAHRPHRGMLKLTVCRCCAGSGWHATHPNNYGRPFPAIWQRG